MAQDQRLSALSAEAAREFGTRLKRWQRHEDLTQGDLGRIARLSQGQISRLLDGRAKEVTPAVRRLAKAAAIDLHQLAPADDPLHARLHAELDRAWDGSKAQADALVSLLRAARALVRPMQDA